MTNKDLYRRLTDTEDTIPIFLRSWWLDAVCTPEAWDAVVVHRGGRAVAAMPYFIRQYGRLRCIEMPPLTQFMGPWLWYPPGQKNATRLGYEKEVMTELIRSLPHVDAFTQAFHYSITNWLPFHWNGYQQSTRYTYLLPDLTDLERVQREFEASTRNDIRHAERDITVVVSDDMERFHRTNTRTYHRQGRGNPNSLQVMKSVDDACRSRDRCRMCIARDGQGVDQAVMYLVWDDHSVFYIMGGGPGRHRGALSLLIWHGIQFAASKGLKFDFEGSMMEGVEHFFRSFGAIQTPFFQVTRPASRKLQAQRTAHALAGKVAARVRDRIPWARASR